MTRGRSPGLLTVLAEVQRQRRREQSAQRRAWEAANLRHQQAYRAAQRAAAGGHRAAVAAYQEAREAAAAHRTAELDRRIGSLRAVLAAGAASAPFQLSQLRTTAPVVPFNAGPLAQPVPMPDPARYQPPPLSGLRALTSAARREHEDQCARGRRQFEVDWHAAQAAETNRRHRVDELHRQHLAWLEDLRRRADLHNSYVDALPARLRDEDPEAVTAYFSAVLSTGTGWPEQFPRRFVAAWDPAARQLVVDWQLPGFDVVPAVSRVRYVKSSDEDKQIALPAGQRAALYREALSQSCLRVVADAFRADHLQQLHSVAFNGYACGPDSATGQQADHFLVAATISRDDLRGIQLEQVDAVSCLTGLRGQVSARPERLVTVRPGRRPSALLGAAAGSPPDEEHDADLYRMDPLAFEDLVAELFRARGLQVMTTARTGDEGVDIVAEDADPITGGRIVIQVKRYRATVSPSVVRELYGAVQHQGATKGILVTTSGFGPGSHEFSAGKPLTLIGGPELVRLLAEHGLPGRLGAAGPAGG